MSVQLASMNISIEDGLLSTMLVKILWDWSISSFGAFLLALLTRDDPTGQTVTLRLIQEFWSEQVTRQWKETSQKKAFDAHMKRNKHMGQGNSSGSVFDCWYCNKTGQVRSECLKRKGNKSKNDVSEKNNREKALVAATESNEQPSKLARTAPQKASINSGVTVHMLKDVSIVNNSAVNWTSVLKLLVRTRSRRKLRVSPLLGCLLGRG